MNLLEEASKVTEYWSPRVVTQVNDQYVKVAKLKGSFTWHKHDNEDEMFQILKGNLSIEYEDKTLQLAEGDIHVVPKGKLHNPFSEEECWVALVETVTTQHTGELQTDQTKSIEEQLG